MTWRTHVAIGTNAIWLAGFLGKVDESILVLLPTAVLASILPDIDAVSAKIHYVGGGVFGIFKNSFHGKYFHHRGLMHSILATVILFVILLIETTLQLRRNKKAKAYSALTLSSAY